MITWLWRQYVQSHRNLNSNSHPVQILFEKGNHLRGKTHFSVDYVIFFFIKYTFLIQRGSRFKGQPNLSFFLVNYYGSNYSFSAVFLTGDFKEE